MILYELAWDNGLDCEDHELSQIGFFTSDELRKAAIKRLTPAVESGKFTFSGPGDGKFVLNEIEADRLLFGLEWLCPGGQP